MGLSKTQRIAILLAIDGAFFLVELVVGYAVHSLALVADAFHMLNDVLSLCVGIWAVKRAKAGRTTRYTYGWQRAETIGALVNGVFLVALCLSIFLEAIQRFVEPQVVTNPKMVLIVGCLGLASNILGLFLFHDHGHSHGGHSHDEENIHHHDPVTGAERGHSHSTKHTHSADETTRLLQDPNGSIEDVLPSVRVAGYQGTPARRGFAKSDETNTTLTQDSSSPFKKKSIAVIDNKHHRRKSSFFTGSIDDMPVHPAGRHDTIIQAGNFEEEQSDTNTDEAVDTSEDEAYSKKPATSKATGYGSTQLMKQHEDRHATHKHRQPKEKKSGVGGHGHSHGDLNMRGVFLHVLGDALGNVGVIASALIIWLAHFPQRYYFDPGISLVITVIILWSAIPLCKAAARILLQAVPADIEVDDIRADIESLEGVKSAHHLHVWQLSDTKIIASLHVRISSEIEHTGTGQYMKLAKEIQECLKEYGIRSSTIQPEFESENSNNEENHLSLHSATCSSQHSPKIGANKTASLRSAGTDKKVCMFDSEDAGEVLQSQGDHDHADHDHGSDHIHNDTPAKGNGKSKTVHQH